MLVMSRATGAWLCRCEMLPNVRCRLAALQVPPLPSARPVGRLCALCGNVCPEARSFPSRGSQAGPLRSPLSGDRSSQLLVCLIFHFVREASPCPTAGNCTKTDVEG